MAFGRARGAMDSGINPWQLKDFEESLDHWISLESPDDDLRLVVTAWVLTRFDDPSRCPSRTWIRQLVVRAHSRIGPGRSNCRLLLFDHRQGAARKVQQFRHSETAVVIDARALSVNL
jgi:hypothetical protein